MSLEFDFVISVHGIHEFVLCANSDLQNFDGLIDSADFVLHGNVGRLGLANFHGNDGNLFLVVVSCI